MDESALQALAADFNARLCPAPPGADVAAWLRLQLEQLRPLGLPTAVAVQVLESSYMEWVGEAIEGGE